MKRILSFFVLAAISAGSIIGQSNQSQKYLIKEEFSFSFSDIYSVGRGGCTGTRHFYSDDEGKAVYHGDVVISKAELEPTIYREDYGKPTLSINGKLRYNEGKLDGPISVSYSYKNIGHKSNMYGLCSGSYSINGAFENGYATGTWTVSCQKTSETRTTKSSKYTITVKYEKGEIVSYTRNTDGDVVTIDKNGYVSGIFNKHNIRHGLELPNNDRTGDELAALMERGQMDSAIWKGIDYHYHFSKKNYGFCDVNYDTMQFDYDILSVTVQNLFNVLGVGKESQFDGKAQYLLYDKESWKYSYLTYNDVVEEGFDRITSVS